ncbi:fimbrillin family protein [Parabacteroides chongii]|uniref:fimbrillin family protein n=1 Tax=Parabacteroides chongii TaxID=2685834 RepID=UPI00240D675F|nr:fimbrillin family protein [Parabacteroides chongii]WFE84403.1 fimbrillin family protein [Parabacteroides chongii]
MKRTEQLYRTAVLLTLLMLAAACTPDDAFDNAAPGNGTDPAAVLTITVTDGAYAAAPVTDTPEASAANAATNNGAPVTRAVERGFATEFTKGDAIGIYVVKKTKEAREVILENGKFTYDGQTWKAEQSQALPSIPHDDEYLYFAYYPYQGDMSSKYTVTIKEDDAKYFFGSLISGWNVEDNQSTYATYTDCDLMVARGVVAPLPDGSQASPSGSTLTFTMEHQMKLAVIRLPHTICTYTETIGGQEVQKSYNLYAGGHVDLWWQENHYTARRIIKPDYDWNASTTSYYYDSEFNKHKFAATANTGHVPGGKYKIYTVDDGKETTTKRPLAEGDFYMNDGTVLPKEAFSSGNLPDDVKDDCIGVVFWVGEKGEYHWTKTRDRKGDRLLMYDHPGCTHGMVVALQDATNGAKWGPDIEDDKSLGLWAENFGEFTNDEQSKWNNIILSGTLYGYSRSAIIDLYTTHNAGSKFPAYQAVKEYANANSTPEESSGWFFPGMNELATIVFGTPNDIGDQTIEHWKNINSQIEKTNGNKMTGRYWSNSDFEGNMAWQAYPEKKDELYNAKPKSDSYKVRAVLAF